MLFQQVGQQMSAAAMNLFKGIVAIVCLVVILIPYGFADIPRDDFLLLALSGLVGICLGDTFYFLTIKCMGSRLALLVGALIPVFTAIIAILLLNERIAFNAGIGLVMTVAGVAYVLWDRSESATTSVSTHWVKGIVFGFLFVLTNAMAIIFTKVGVENIPAMDATLVRTAWAVLGLFFWGLVTRSMVSWTIPLKDRGLRNKLIIASVVGAFLGTWLSVVALKFTHAAVAVTLNSTSPLFILPLAIWVLKERVSRRAISGAIIACLGIATYFFSIMN